MKNLTILFTIFLSSLLSADNFHNRISVFDPFHLIYERLKKDSIYVGIDAWACYAFSSDNTTINTFVSNNKPIGELELRLGYNFLFNQKDHFVPIIGLGTFKDWNHETYQIWKIKYESENLDEIIYGTFGFLYNHDFNRLFNLGFNIKGIIGGPISDKQWGSSVIGGDFSFPISFRFGYKRHWDLRLEPFAICLCGTNLTRNYIGYRGTLGYRF